MTKSVRCKKLKLLILLYNVMLHPVCLACFYNVLFGRRIHSITTELKFHYPIIEKSIELDLHNWVIKIEKTSGDEQLLCVQSLILHNLVMAFVLMRIFW